MTENTADQWQWQWRRGPRPAWLEQARFYEVYPQSFQDSNGDGIGDLPGLISRLDYIRDLGCNALWVNPIYDSPFKDAGYDVRDYTTVAPRYGTLDDARRLFTEAHRRGMRVLLDLIPGHTSEEHAWFRASGRERPEDRTLDGVSMSERYIWTDCWISGGNGLPFVGGETPRDGTYILNFFKCQPALNYGFAHPCESWQRPAIGPDALDPDVISTCDAMVDVMRFWLGLGADGFRVDMADSLVKNDDSGKPFTIRTWRYMFSQIRPEFPDAAFVSEWGRPYESLDAGFDMDFYLDWRWAGNPNGYNILLRNTDTPMVRDNDRSYFNADTGESVHGFLDQYLPQLRDAERLGGLFCLITGNHDTLRVGQRLTERELRIAYGMLLTMPGAPFVYYGDEIGMHYRRLPTKEGGYVRTGSRTPMQWDSGANRGFSTAPADRLYLPVNPADDATNVADQLSRDDSLCSWVRRVLAMRADCRALDSGAAFDVIEAPHVGRRFAYVRTAVNDVADGVGDAGIGGVDAAGAGTDASRVLVALNPGHYVEPFDLPHDVAVGAAAGMRNNATVSINADMAEGFAADGSRTMLRLGDVRLDGDTLTLGPQSYLLLRLG
ncbi:alpha-amylase family glycosyl hydrolase [Bifidobacterium vansinderenii]|uniref:Alpha-amylase n=1 Tax=Bifidobacterium vansinderenii TaxID=1984871 RepID=A0A229VVL6_9BIFI|nr:alpha-amylase family glycosyl hydrolase [Bifidobacterium vansinderenii]OXM99663.1 alpha-amylase [Bifidobacterium vansinderenii]